MSFYSKLGGFNLKKFQMIFYQKLRFLTRKEPQPFYVASSPSTDRITFFFLMQKEVLSMNTTVYKVLALIFKYITI